MFMKWMVLFLAGCLVWVDMCLSTMALRVNEFTEIRWGSSELQSCLSGGSLRMSRKGADGMLVCGNESLW